MCSISHAASLSRGAQLLNLAVLACCGMWPLTENVEPMCRRCLQVPQNDGRHIMQNQRVLD
jgi:hypothetical protein